jgi:hypothetical protein
MLQPGNSVRADLRSGQITSFEIRANAGEYFRALVRPNGAQINIRLSAPSGGAMANLMNEAGEQRTLPISVIAPQKGAYRLEVTLADPDAPARDFECTLVELREAKPADEIRIAAEKAFNEGKRLQSEGSKESLNQAIAKFEAALPQWRAIGDQAEEGPAACKGGGRSSRRSQCAEQHWRGHFASRTQEGAGVFRRIIEAEPRGSRSKSGSHHAE